jgi:hypothetical protein
MRRKASAPRAEAFPLGSDMLETVKTFIALSEEFVEESCRLWPVRATAAGIHDYDHLLPDDTPDGNRARSAWLRDLEQRLAASVTWEELPTEQRVDYALLRSQLAALRAELDEIRRSARDPVRCLRTALDGVLLLTRPFAPFDDRKEALIARLIAIPEYLEAAHLALEPAPPVWLETALEVADGAPVLVNEIVRSLLREFPQESERIEHAGARANSGIVQFRETIERQGAGPGGAWALGARWLEFVLEREHLLPLGHRELDLLGRDQVADARRALVELARRTPDTWRDRLAAACSLRGAVRAGEAAEAELARARRFVLERRLTPVPDVPLDSAPAPAYRRPLFAHAACLPPAPFDVEPRGTLLLPAAPSARSAGTASPEDGRGLVLVAAREGWPGRHLQNGLAIHAGSRLRRMAADRILASGWALYAEELMVDEGYGAEADAALGWALDRLESAARAVAAVALHSGTMSLEQAAAYLREHAMLEPPDAEAEVKRLTLDPARGIGGLVGRLQVIELRDDARRRLGTKYDRLEFHAALPLLREELWERLGVSE